jgi:uncharacterized coiled-coil protein SlyX
LTILTDILDRLSGVAALKEKITHQDKVIEGMQRIMLEQQRDLAELKGTLRAMVTLQTDRKR